MLLDTGMRLSELTGLKFDDSFGAVSEAGDMYQAKAVIYAAGKSPRKLNVPGEAELTARG